MFRLGSRRGNNVQAKLKRHLLVRRVWDTAQLSEELEVLGFIAPYVVVRRKSDGCKASLEFQHSPRFYFNFVLDQ